MGIVPSGIEEVDIINITTIFYEHILHYTTHGSMIHCYGMAHRVRVTHDRVSQADY